MKKKIATVMIGVLVLAAGITACNGKEKPTASDIPAVSETSEISGAAADVLSTADCYKAIQEKIALPEMYLADDEYIMNYYGIDTAKLSDYTFASCTDPTRTDTVILMELKDEADADEIEACLNLYLEQMEAEMENYNPAANELVKASSVRRNGNRIDLIICEDRESALALADGTSK
ncbi:MAG: DUF4358 domain-containing protein [Lachnospiraceae bacterium]|nr:DUF4358 domain-containing protein [Lachnospiraceae bacterium]